MKCRLEEILKGFEELRNRRGSIIPSWDPELKKNTQDFKEYICKHEKDIKRKYSKRENGSYGYGRWSHQNYTARYSLKPYSVKIFQRSEYCCEPHLVSAFGGLWSATGNHYTGGESLIEFRKSGNTKVKFDGIIAEFLIGSFFGY